MWRTSDWADSRLPIRYTFNNDFSGALNVELRRSATRACLQHRPTLRYFAESAAQLVLCKQVSTLFYIASTNTWNPGLLFHVVSSIICSRRHRSLSLLTICQTTSAFDGYVLPATGCCLLCSVQLQLSTGVFVAKFSQIKSNQIY